MLSWEEWYATSGYHSPKRIEAEKEATRQRLETERLHRLYVAQRERDPLKLIAETEARIKRELAEEEMAESVALWSEALSHLNDLGLDGDAIAARAVTNIALWHAHSPDSRMA